MNFFFFSFFFISDELEIFLFLFLFLFLSFWFYYFFCFYELIVLALVKLHFKFFEEYLLYFQAPSFYYWLPKVYNLYFTWFPNKYLYFDYFWSQELTDDQIKDFIKQMTAFSSFIEMARDEAETTFKQMDRGYAERFKRAAGDISIKDMTFDTESRFSYWSAWIAAQEDPDAEVQQVDINFQNYNDGYNFLKNKKLFADKYDLRRKYIVTEFLDKELNVENIQDYINKYEKKTINLGRKKFEFNYNKKTYKDFEMIQKKVDYYHHMLYRKNIFFDQKMFMKQLGWDINGIKNNNMIRNTKFYKNKLTRNHIHSYLMISNQNADDWLDEFSIIGRFFLPLYFLIASAAIVYMFFFIINFEFMTFFYLLLTLSYLFLF